MVSAETLTPDEREELLREVARVFYRENEAWAVLRPLQLRRERLPTWVGMRPEHWWAAVFDDFDNGIVPDPYRRLLSAALKHFVANEVFLRMSGRLTPKPALVQQRAGGRIFLCHASEDIPAIRDLYDKLRADGLNPWLDERDIPPGMEWDVEIYRVIMHSDFFLVLLTANSFDKEGYLQREISRALLKAEELPKGKIFIIPVRLDDSTVPDRLAKWHWVNLFEPEGYGRLLKTLRSEWDD